MKAYIGTKIILAEPRTFKDPVTGDTTDGYSVRYPDGYVSWSPKATFEAAYREISDEEGNLIAALDLRLPA